MITYLVRLEVFNLIRVFSYAHTLYMLATLRILISYAGSNIILGLHVSGSRKNGASSKCGHKPGKITIKCSLCNLESLIRASVLRNQTMNESELALYGEKESFISCHG